MHQHQSLDLQSSKLARARSFRLSSYPSLDRRPAKSSLLKRLDSATNPLVGLTAFCFGLSCFNLSDLQHTCLLTSRPSFSTFVVVSFATCRAPISDAHFADWWGRTSKSSHRNHNLRKEVRLTPELSELFNVRLNPIEQVSQC